MKAAIFARDSVGSRRYVAYHWVLGEVGPGSVLDFGSWDSPLPCQLALDGHSVLAVDRDNRFLAEQRRLAEEHGVNVAARWWNAALDRDGVLLGGVTFSNVTSVFALEHNVSIDTIRAVSETLGRLLREDGRFLVVGRYAEGTPYLETKGEDTVSVINHRDYRNAVIGPSQCELVKEDFFLWDDLADTTVPCKRSRANIIALHLRKKDHD